MMNFAALAAEATKASGTTAQPGGSPWIMIVIWVVVIGAMWFLMIRPQRKKQKEEQKMRANVRVGDEITTIGGICGRIVNIKEDEFVIETGADRNKLTIKKWAMQSSQTIHDEPADDDDDDDDDI